MGMDEELESLREKSTRASAIHDDLEGGGSIDQLGDESGKRFTQKQKLLLAFLFFINVLALTCAILLLSGRLPF